MCVCVCVQILYTYTYNIMHRKILIFVSARRNVLCRQSIAFRFIPHQLSDFTCRRCTVHLYRNAVVYDFARKVVFLTYTQTHMQMHIVNAQIYICFKKMKLHVVEN